MGIIWTKYGNRDINREKISKNIENNDIYITTYIMYYSYSRNFLYLIIIYGICVKKLTSDLNFWLNLSTYIHAKKHIEISLYSSKSNCFNILLCKSTICKIKKLLMCSGAYNSVRIKLKKKKKRYNINISRISSTNFLKKSIWYQYISDKLY